MTTTFYLSPTNPKDIGDSSNLYIDPEYYKNALIDRWQTVEFIKSDSSDPLVWIIHTTSGGNLGGVMRLMGDFQTVSFLFTYEYILWHRKLIPEKYSLVLYNDSAWKLFNLLVTTTQGELRSFLENP